MAINFLKDKIIKYFVNRKGPSTWPGKNFGEEAKGCSFWIYFAKNDKDYLVKKRTGFLQYQCIKVVTLGEPTLQYTKFVEINNGYSFFTDIRVRLLYKSFPEDYLSPVRALFYAVTGYYKILAWRVSHRLNRSIKKNEKARSIYKDRFALLALLISIRNNQHDSTSMSWDTIDTETLVLATAKVPFAAGIGFYKHIDPILRGLEDEKAVKIDGSRVTVMPKAWCLLNEFYLEEQRHKDNQNALRWQRYLTGWIQV